MEKAKDLRGIRQKCRLGPLKGRELDAWWVGTDAARSSGEGLRHVIRETLAEREDARILVCGHGGCGKSTELNKLVQDLGGDWFPVTFSVHDEMNLTGVVAEDVILVVTERLLAAAEGEGLNLPDDILEPIHKYFAQVIQKTFEDKGFDASQTTKVSAGTPSLLSLLKLFAELKGEIKFSAHSVETAVSTLRKRPADLQAQANAVIDAVRQALPEGRRLLIIVEDLDKLDIATAHEVFIRNARLLTGLSADIIYTIPIFTFHSPEAGVLHASFDATATLPMIEPLDISRERAPGFDTIRQIVLSRIDASAIEDDALDLLVEKTGGVLQHAFKALHDATFMRGAALPLQKGHIAHGLQQKRNEFWSEVTLPRPSVEGLDSVDQLYDRLADYAKQQAKKEKPRPLSDAINQILLKSAALVEYNGERWFGVHPLVIENLKDLGRI